MQYCNKCNKSKPEDEFYINKTSKTGYSHKCKSCIRKYAKEYYSHNKESVSKQHKKYRKTDRGIMLARKHNNDWYQRNRHRKLEKVAEHKKNNPEKIKAKAALNNALKSGRLTRPYKCERCESSSNIQGHHYDYSLPLEVIWLCCSCHTKEHYGVSS